MAKGISAVGLILTVSLVALFTGCAGKEESGRVTVEQLFDDRDKYLDKVVTITARIVETAIRSNEKWLLVEDQSNNPNIYVKTLVYDGGVGDQVEVSGRFVFRSGEIENKEISDNPEDFIDYYIDATGEGYVRRVTGP
jgi:hypothetical protein